MSNGRWFEYPSQQGEKKNCRGTLKQHIFCCWCRLTCLCPPCYRLCGRWLCWLFLRHTKNITTSKRVINHNDKSWWNHKAVLQDILIIQRDISLTILLKKQSQIVAYSNIVVKVTCCIKTQGSCMVVLLPWRVVLSGQSQRDHIQLLEGLCHKPPKFQNGVKMAAIVAREKSKPV